MNEMMNEYCQQLLVEDLKNENKKFDSILFSSLKSNKNEYLPTVVDCNNWLKLIVSEEETGVWIRTLLIDDRGELIVFVVWVSKKSDVEEESNRKFSKPGGGPIVCCLSQTKSFTWFKNTSSNVFIESFDVACEGVVETNKAARSASVKL